MGQGFSYPVIQNTGILLSTPPAAADRLHRSRSEPDNPSALSFSQTNEPLTPSRAVDRPDCSKRQASHPKPTAADRLNDRQLPLTGLVALPAADRPRSNSKLTAADSLRHLDEYILQWSKPTDRLQRARRQATKTTQRRHPPRAARDVQGKPRQQAKSAD